MASAAASASDATIIEWLYVPGASRNNLFNKGLPGCDKSISLTGDTTLENSSTIGRRPIARMIDRIADTPVHTLDSMKLLNVVAKIAL